MESSSDEDTEMDENDKGFVCPHVDTVDTLRSGKKLLAPKYWKCKFSECDESSAIYGCLSCGYISCDDQQHKEGHSYKHFIKKKHPIIIDFTSYDIWCYKCDQKIDNDTVSNEISLIITSLKNLQERHADNQLHETRSGKQFGVKENDDDVINETSRKAQQFKQKDQTDNAKAHYQMTLLRKMFDKWQLTKSKTQQKRIKSPKANAVSGVKRKRNQQNIDNNNDNSIKAPAKKKLKRTPTKHFSRRTGLRNLGNTCYFNSAVQCLNSSDTFRQFFLKLPDLVPPHALTAQLPELNIKTTKKSKRNIRGNNIRTIQTRSSLRQSKRRLNDNKKRVSICDDQPIIMQSKRGKKELTPSLTSDEADNKICLVAPPRGLLRRRTTMLHATMENSAQLNDNTPISLSAEVYTLLRIFESGKYSVLTPQRLAYSIWTAIPQFRSYRQQDAQEFFNLFLERLELEIKAFSANDNDIDTDSDDTDNDNNIKTPTFYVKDSFHCTKICVTTCDECKNQSCYRPPGTKFISLDVYGTIQRMLNKKKKELQDNIDDNNNNNNNIGRSRHRSRTKSLSMRQLSTSRAFDRTLLSYNLCNLNDLLNEMITQIVFNGDNQYYCEKCDKKVNAIRNDYCYKLPNVLVFHLKRAHWSVRGQQKLKNQIQFPLNNLNMNKYCFNKDNNNNNNDNDSVYDLIAALVHSGRSMNQGHYIAYCYHRDTDRWFKFDDRRVTVSTFDKVKESQAYLLFYEKQGIQNWIDGYINNIEQQMNQM